MSDGFVVVVGYVFDRWMLYGDRRLSWSQSRVLEESRRRGDEDKV